MLSSGLTARAVETFRLRAGGWPVGLSEGRECRALAADSPYRFVFCRRPRGRRVGGSAVRLPQRSLRSEDGRTAEVALPLGLGSGRLAGRGLAGVFPQGGSGLRLSGVGHAGWSWGPVPEGGWYGKGQGGGFLSSERPGAELKAEREGVEREERRLADTADYNHYLCIAREFWLIPVMCTVISYVHA